MSEQEVSDNFEFGPGALLKKAREQQEISIKEVADRLKLMEKSVRDIESDDYKDIPMTFVKGYVKNYAQLLHLDIQETTENFNRYVAKKGLDRKAKPNSYRSVSAENKSNVKFARLFIRFVSILLLLALLYSVYYLLSEKGYWNKFINSFDKKEAAQEQILESDDASDNEGELIPEDLQMQSNKLAEPSNQHQVGSASLDLNLNQASLENNATVMASTTVETTEPLSIIDDYQVNFNFSGDCWLQLVDANGRILISGTKRNGHNSSVTGVPPYQLTVGKVSTVSIQYQGKEIDLSAYSDARIARLTIGS